MRMVPDWDRLVVESRVEPREIDQVRLGQTAVLRFNNFNQRTTPEVDGISASLRSERGLP